MLIWIHGGGYTIGSKDQYGPPAGLLSRASNGIVFVSLNYRLGAFGFISGPTLQADGVANAGLLDQRLALQWVQEHISKFGGDPQNVTVMGESAGGGSILHHITVCFAFRTRFYYCLLLSPSTSAQIEISGIWRSQ